MTKDIADRRLNMMINKGPQVVVDIAEHMAFTTQNHTVLSTSDGAMASCSPLPPRAPTTSVRRLGPADVRVVAAIGDSITAAFAAKGVLPLEFRGLSFSIGGDAGRVTLPNILQTLTVREKLLVGPALGVTDPLVDAIDIFGPKAVRPVNPAIAHLDAAVSNAQSVDAPSQVAWLANVMKQYEADGLISMQHDWKLVTITMGANDLRAVCKGKTPPDKVAEQFKAAMNKTLSLMRQDFPRTLVSLLAVPDVGDMGIWGHSTKLCSFVQNNLEGGHCPQGGESDAVQKAMNIALQELEEYWSDTLKMDDFAVIYHPLTRKLKLPNVSYLSKVDCFHPGYKGHAEMAVALWNSLLTPRRQKKTSFSVGAATICPNKDSIFFVN